MDESESLIINGEREIDDEFYEKIEAPKFVDLTAPDPYQPGEDRSWFCLRVGCDQNHDEEMDSEAIYKNFVLRVMAARSPNIRLRKALCRKDSGLDAKCPRTVPAKPSKSRVTRMALISSISKRIVDTKVKVKPLSKQNPTPKMKAKRTSVIAKALTTPRSKKHLANPEAFRSVRNPRTTANAAQSCRVVAKTLVFDSPKKVSRTKISLDLNTPLKTLCAGMKKLEITSEKKQALGYNRPLPSNISRKQFRGREVKSRVFDGLNSQKDKFQLAKSTKCMEKNKKENNLQKDHDPVCCERVENDVNDIEIEEKTANASKGVCSSTTTSGDGNISVGNLAAAEISRPPSVEVLSDASRIDSNSLLNYERRSSGDDDNVPQFQSPAEIMERDGKRQGLNSDDNENASEAMDSDDKENALASDDNRELNVKTSHTEHKILVKHEIPKGIQKTTITKSKQFKESTPAANSAQCLKLKKPKPTNPKPFRLRTDERGILKEANLEKKVCPAPLCEIAAVPKAAGGNSQEKHKKAPQRDAKCLEQNENHNTTNEDSEKERQDHQRPQNKILRVKIGKERMGRKISSIPQKHTISSKQKLVASQQKTSQDNSTPNSENRLRKTKTPSIRQLSRLKEEASIGSETISKVETGQLGTIKETSPTILRATAAGKPSVNGAYLATKASVSPARRRSKTIPREPNFHIMHTPRSCTRRVA